MGSAPLLPRQALLSRWCDGTGATIDRGIQIYFPAPASYTGEDVVEFHGHGNPVVLRALLDRLLELGARPAGPGEFTRRAVFHGKMDLTQAEAVAATIDAATRRAAMAAQRQLDGAFGRFIGDCMDRITALLATVEAQIDFVDEDLPRYAGEALRKQAEELCGRLRRSLATAPFGMRLFSGVEIAIVGAPNVGKSTLLNRLSGCERAIVSDRAGTTRDLLEVDLELAGIPVRLVDTAGLHASDDPIELEGMRRARAAAERADLVLLVVDATDGESRNCAVDADIRVMNKCDLIDPGEVPQGFLPICARSGEGVERLLEEIVGRIDAAGCATGEDAMITRLRHREAVERALLAVERGMALLDSEEMLDLAAAEWRSAWAALGEIVGIGDVERILDRIFSTFCIGK